MEARATLRGPIVSRTLVAGVLVSIALGVGATGGYIAANLGVARVASPSHVAAPTQTIDRSRYGPWSDLTRVLPTAPPAAVLPDWLVQEITPKTAPTPRIRQDDPNFITLPAPTSARASE